MFRMAYNIKTHTNFVYQYGTHPLIDSANETMGVVATDLVFWLLYGMQNSVLWLIVATKYIVEEWLLFYLLCGYATLLMIRQTSNLSRKYVRLQKRLRYKGRDMILLCLDTLHINTSMKLRSEWKWQPSNAASGYVLDEAHEVCNNNLKFTSKLFGTPYKYVRKRMEKPPDRLLIVVYTPLWITFFYMLYLGLGIVKIWYFGSCKLYKKVVWVMTQLQKTTTIFASSTGIDFLHKRVRRRRKSDKSKRKRRKNKIE